MTMPSRQSSSANVAVMYSGLTINPSTLIPGQLLSASEAVEPAFEGRNRQAL